VPYPDLDRKLDFESLQASGGSDQQRWGAQFSDGGEENALVPADLGGGHLVLARKSADPRELRP
jgi:peptide/nickel transport system ATP-binding protein